MRSKFTKKCNFFVFEICVAIYNRYYRAIPTLLVFVLLCLTPSLSALPRNALRSPLSSLTLESTYFSSRKHGSTTGATKPRSPSSLPAADCIIIRPSDQIHLSSEVTDSLESDHLCVMSCFDVSVARSCPVYRYVRNIRGIDRSAFVADLETELVGIGHSLSADQYNVTLLSVLDKHAPAAKSRVTERMSSPWFGLVREDLLEAKRSRRQAERKWRNTNLTVFKDLYKKAKHHVTNVVLKAKKLYYNSKISSANCSKELYKITNNILARTKQVHLPTTYPLSSLPELFSNYFSDKIMKIRNELDSQAVSALPAQADSFSGITLSTFEPVTEAMVKLVITKSAPKTCSLDPIPTPLLLEILDCLLPSLTALINSSLSSGLFPQAFKSAVIFPLLKKPSLDPNELKNFAQSPTYRLSPKSLKNLFWFKFLDICLRTTFSTNFSQLIDQGTLQKQLF